MTVTTISDETLMALADGELHGDEAAALRAHIARDADLAARYGLFVETRLLAQDPSPAPASREDPLAAMIRARDRVEAASAPRPRLGVIEGGAGPIARHETRPRPRNVLWRLPAAAAVVFALGGITGFLLSPGGPSPTAGIAVMPAAQAALDGALSRVASGQEAAWTGRGLAGRILIVSTHRLADGTPCREFQIGTDGRDTIVGASCRRDGQWRTEMALTAAASGSGYTPASGGAAVDEHLAQRGSAGPLTPDEESALLARGWRD